MTIVHGMSIQARDGASEQALKQTVALVFSTLENFKTKTS
jgi:hypothetical protein